MFQRFGFFLGCLFVLCNASAQQCVAPHWVKKYGGSGAEGLGVLLPDSARLSFCTAAGYGTSITLGSFTLTNSAGSGIYIARFDTAGNVIMATSVGYCVPSTSQRIQLWNVTNDRSGNIYLTGYYNGTVNIGGQTLTANTNADDGFVAKFSPAGIMEWIVVPPSTFSTELFDVTVDDDLNVYAVGYFSYPTIVLGLDTLRNYNVTLGFEDIMVFKLDSAGQYVWARHAGTTQNDYGYRVVHNNQGEIFVLSNVRGTPALYPPGCSVPIAGTANYNLVVTRYDATTGDAEWAGPLSSPNGNQNILVRDLVCDNTGGFYITGSYAGYCYFPPISLPLPPNSAEFFLARFNHDGSCAWVRTGGAFNSTDEGNAIDIYNGKVSVCGKLSNFNPVFSNFMLPGSYTMFTAVYDTLGTLQWMRGAATNTSNAALGTAFDVTGTVYTSGYFSGTQPWPPVSITSTGTADGFIVKYKAFTSLTPVASAGPDRITTCGASVQLAGSVTPSSGTTYGWTPGYNLSSVTSLTPNAFPGVTTSYYLTAVNNGCVDQDTVLVTVSNNTMTASAGSNLSFCDGDSVQLSATCNTPGATVSWSPAAGLSAANIANPWAKPVQTTTYIVTFTSASCIARDTVIVQVNPEPVVILPASSNICAGSSLTLTCGNTNYGTVYNWTSWNTVTGLNTTTGPTVIASPPVSNSYTVNAVNQFGCTNSGMTDLIVTPISPTPTFTVNPVNTSICAGNSVNFTAALNSIGLSYRWEIDSTGNGFTLLTSGSPYFNVANAALTVNPVTAAMNGYRFRCRGNAPCSPYTYSSVAILTVTGAPVITAQPPNRSICPAQNTTFPVTANGSGNTYQWQVDPGSGFVNLVNGAPYSGVTAATLTITGATAVMNGYQYRCRVTGCTPSGITYSSPGMLSVGQPPVVTLAPENDTACNGNGASFTVTSTGGTSYSWQVNTGSGFVTLTNTPPYSGVTTTTLTISAATAGMNGYSYRCVINGGCSTQILSGAALLTVVSPPVVSFVLQPDTTCSSATAFALSGGSPAGGTYSGPGVSGGFFDPGAAGAGTHTLTYTATNYGCAASATASLLVAAPATISFATSPVLCTNGPAITLSASPAGGTFAGTAVSGNTFDPAAAGAGVFPVSYTISNGCISSDTQLVTVATPPVVSVGTFGEVCFSDPAFVLSGGAPSGGTYSGPGISANAFDPSSAGTGLHFITYTYSDANGCTSATGDSILVLSLPAVSLAPFAQVCVNSPVLPLSGGTPSGGTYSGPGVTAGNFDPAATGAGTFTIVYNYTDSLGCTGSSSSPITVDLCLGDQEAIPLTALTIAPVPANGQLNVTYVTVHSGTMCVRLLDLHGALLLEKKMTVAAGATTAQLDVSAFANGLYLVQVISDEQTLQRKIEISR